MRLQGTASLGGICRSLSGYNLMQVFRTTQGQELESKRSCKVNIRAVDGPSKQGPATPPPDEKRKSPRRSWTWATRRARTGCACGCRRW